MDVNISFENPNVDFQIDDLFTLEITAVPGAKGDPGDPATDEQVQTAVDNYLDEHPEIVVEDGSITTDKLADGAVTNAKIAEGTITGNKFVPALPITEIKSTSGAKYEQSATTRLGVTHTALLVTSDHYQNALGAVNFTTTATYAVGDYVVYNKKTYKCINTHSGAWSASDFEETQILPRLDDAEESITNVNSELTNKADAITNTASGAIALFSDGADDLPMDSVICHIEPYQSGSGDPSPDNVRPITGYTGLTLHKDYYYHRCFPYDDSVKVGDIVATDSGISVEYLGYGKYHIFGTSTANALAKFRIKPFDTLPTTDTARKLALHNSNADAQTGIYFYNLSDAFIDSSVLNPANRSGGYNVLAGKTIGYVAFYVQTGKTVDFTVLPEFYTTEETTYTVDWTTEAGTVYGGTLDVVSGLLTVDRAMVDLSTLTWNATSNNRYYANWMSGLKVPASANVAANVIAEKYPTKAINDFVSSGIAIGIDGSQHFYVRTGTSETPTGNAVYEKATPLTYQLTPQEVKSLLGANNLWHNNNGNTDASYKADTKLYVDDLTIDNSAMIAPVESAYIATRNYTTGSLLIVNNTLYKVTANIANGGNIVPNTNVLATTLAEIIASL